MGRPAVFLDRDGVLNSYVYNEEFGTVDSPLNPEEFSLVSGAASAVARLNRIGLAVVVVSNQPGVAKKKFTEGVLAAVTKKMVDEVAKGGGTFDGIYYCLHHPNAAVSELRQSCGCRKPAPGLLLQACHELDLDLNCSYMIGDGISDVRAGDAAGCTTILVSTRKCYLCDELARQDVRPHYLVPSLASAADLIEALAAGISQPHYSFVCP